MSNKSSIVYLCLLFISATTAMSTTLSVNISIDNGSPLLSEPVGVQVNVLNTGDRAVDLAPLSANGDNRVLEFYVATPIKTNQIIKPILVLEQAEGNGHLAHVSVHSGQTVSERFLLGVDWDSEEPIFSIGTNWLFCVLRYSDGEEIKSNILEVIVHAPKTRDEIEAQSLISDHEVLRSIYSPEYLLLVKHPDAVVLAIRKIAMTDQVIAECATQALHKWKKYEQDARDGKAPGLKAKGFDRLGLTDLKD